MNLILIIVYLEILFLNLLNQLDIFSLIYLNLYYI